MNLRSCSPPDLCTILPNPYQVLCDEELQNSKSGSLPGIYYIQHSSGWSGQTMPLEEQPGAFGNGRSLTPFACAHAALPSTACDQEQGTALFSAAPQSSVLQAFYTYSLGSGLHTSP